MNKTTTKKAAKKAAPKHPLASLLAATKKERDAVRLRAEKAERECEALRLRLYEAKASADKLTEEFNTASYARMREDDTYALLESVVEDLEEHIGATE